MDAVWWKWLDINYGSKPCVERAWWDLLEVVKNGQSVPCRHHKTDVTTGEIREFIEVKNFMPAFMPTKANHDAFFRGDW